MTCLGKIPTPIGSWTALKLEYLDHYLQAYRKATKSARETYYIDAFAGSGDLFVRKTGWPIKGSAWRALKAVPPFTKYFFVEKDPALAAHLRTAVRNEGIQNAEVFIGDCNTVIPSDVLPNVPRNVPSCAFLDPSGLQLRWNTIMQLSGHRLGRWKMELMILFPYDMFIKRWISQVKVADALTRFFGDQSWRQEYQESERLGETEQARRERFVKLYMRKLGALGYRFVECYGPLKYGERRFYHVIFASDHPVGLKIMQAVWSKPRAIPGQLDYVPVPRPALRSSGGSGTRPASPRLRPA